MVIRVQSQPEIDIQGHRGARGVLPENTIPAFIYALEQGVTTLELDVVITADQKVVVSHEPWISADICLQPDGSAISSGEQHQLNIYQMTYSEVKSYDCGSKQNSRFPNQQSQAAVKPLLSEVIKTVERHMKSFTKYEVDYNIEIKSSVQGDNVNHPNPEEFSELVYNLIDQYLPWNRIVIQSFDFRVLRYWHNRYPNVRLAALVENRKSVSSNLRTLGFTPSIYSPYYKRLGKSDVIYLHNKNVRVIPWTVNDKAAMQRLVSMGVDGIITDYPAMAGELGLTLSFSKESK